jgi:hypothetical protein
MFDVLELALPNCQHLPSLLYQFSLILRVSSLIGVKFRTPEVQSRFRHSGQCAFIVPMPKATVNKDDFSASPKDDIGAAGQVPGVKPISIAFGVNQAAHNHLGSRVLGVNSGHDFGPFGWRYVVHTYYSPSMRRKSGDLSSTYFSAASRITHAKDTFFSRAIRSRVSRISGGSVTETRGAALFRRFSLFAVIIPLRGASWCGTVMHNGLYREDAAEFELCK